MDSDPPVDMEPDLSISLLAYPSTSAAAEQPVSGVSSVRKTRQRAAYFSDEDASDDDQDEGVWSRWEGGDVLQ